MRIYNLCTICISLKSVEPAIFFDADGMGLSSFAYTQPAPRKSDVAIYVVVRDVVRDQSRRN